MVRFYVIGAILAVTVLIYALIDLTVTSDARIARMNRILWMLVIVLVPVVGPVLWLVLGKRPVAEARPLGPDDDPAFAQSYRATLDQQETDRRIRELEEQLAALEAEEQAEAERRAAQPADEQDDDPEADSQRM